VNLKARAEKLKQDIPAVFLALKKPETPLLAKVLAVVVVVYALSPIDLIPDFIPVVGYLDDLLLLPALVALTVKLIGKEVFARCQNESLALWQDGRPVKWVYAIPFLLLYLLLGVLVIKAIAAVVK